MKDILKKIDEMSDEEIYRKMCSSEDKCNPKTCKGQCQGFGWCDEALSFRLEFGL